MLLDIGELPVSTEISQFTGLIASLVEFLSVEDLKFVTLSVCNCHVSVVVSKGVIFAFAVSAESSETVTSCHMFLLVIFAQFLRINPKSLDQLVENDMQYQKKLMSEFTVRSLGTQTEQIQKFEKFGADLAGKIDQLYKDFIEKMSGIEYITDIRGEPLFGQIQPDLKEYLIPYAQKLGEERDGQSEQTGFTNAKVEMVVIDQRSIYILGLVNVLDGLICATRSSERFEGKARIMSKNSFRIHFSSVSGDDARTPTALYSECKGVSEYLQSLFTPSSPKKPEPPKQPTAAYRRKQIPTQKGVAKFFNPLVPISPNLTAPKPVFDLDLIQEDVLAERSRVLEESPSPERQLLNQTVPSPMPHFDPGISPILPQDTGPTPVIDMATPKLDTLTTIRSPTTPAVTESMLEQMKFDNEGMSEVAEEAKVPQVEGDLPHAEIKIGRLAEETIDAEDVVSVQPTPVEPSLPKPPTTGKPLRRPISRALKIKTMLRNGSEAALRFQHRKPSGPKPGYIRKLSKADSLKELSTSQLLDINDKEILEELGIEIFTLVDKTLDRYSEMHHRPSRKLLQQL